MSSCFVTENPPAPRNLPNPPRELPSPSRPPTLIEFGGWLPVFQRFGNCGQHPQFAHTGEPPPGYRFLCSDPRQQPPSQGLFARLGRHCFALFRKLASTFRPLLTVCRTSLQYGPRRSCRALSAVASLFFRLLRQGHSPAAIARFLHSRHFESQVLLPRSQLVFLTSVPYTFGQDPWVIEIEDSTTLFYPFLRNGETASLDPTRSPYFSMVRTLLEANSCRGILTHIRSTAENLPRLFQSETIARKVFHVPLGVKLPPRAVHHSDVGPINLLFTNSWHQDPQSFFLRGGLDVLEAFDVLRVRYPQLRLTLRASLPRLDDRHGRMLQQEGVRVLGHYLAHEHMEELLEQTHLFLLPAARVHIVSILRAMSYGQVVVASDGWGIDEHLEHLRTGMIVPGRAGKTSWMDTKVGMLREDYQPMFRPDPVVVQGLIDTISLLVEDLHLRQRLGQAARSHVEQTHGLRQWNQGLKAVFDQITPPR